MVEGLHLYLSDEEIEKIRNGGHVSFDFEYGELSKVMNILIYRKKENTYGTKQLRNF